MAWLLKKKTEIEIMRENLMKLNERWSELTKNAIIKDFAHEPEEEMKKVHDDIEKVLDDMYNITQKLKEIGDNKWIDEFKKMQEKKMIGL